MTQRKLAYYTNDDLNNKTDNELVASAKNGNEEALECLFNKYKELVNMKVSKYFIIGAEREDIVQEGMIGLYKAVKNYDSNKNIKQTKTNSNKSIAFIKHTNI